MPWVAIEVPPEPPAEMMPPRSRRVARKASKASAIAAVGAAPVVAEHRRLALRMMARHLARMHAGGRGLAGGRQVDRDHAQAQLLEALAQEGQLAALGVEGARDIGRAFAAGRDRELEHARRRGTPAAAGGGFRRAARTRRTMSATGAAVPPAFQRVKPRTVLGARSSSDGAPSPWARRTVKTCVGGGVVGRGDQRIFELVALAAGAHAQQPLLQFAVGRQLGRRHLLRDAAVDHQADAIGHRRWRRRGSARSAAPRCGPRPPARAGPAPPARRSPAPGPSVGSSITSSCGLSSSARPIASICCSPPDSCAPPWPRRSASRGNMA